MNDKIRSAINTAYMLFVFEFADPTSVTLETKNPLVVFDSQKSADKMKKELGKDGFRKFLSLYFSSFQSPRGLDFRKLDHEITKNKKVLLRHLGKDKMTYLSLVVSVLKAVEEPRRGLLGVAI